MSSMCELLIMKRDSFLKMKSGRHVELLYSSGLSKHSVTVLCVSRNQRCM